MTVMALSPTASFASALPHPGQVSFRVPVLPWAASAEDDRRFRRIVGRVLVVALLLALTMPFVPLQKVDRIEVQPLPPPIAKLLLERDKVAPPPPRPAEPEVALARPEPKPELANKPAPVKPVKGPNKDAAPVPVARNPVEGKPPGEVALDNARRKASGVGLLAMKNELADMTGAPVAVQLQKDIKPGPGVGSGIGPGVGAGLEPGVPVRAMITSNATRGSGGINTAAYSRDTGGGGLAGRATTLVEGVAGGGGGGGAGGGGSRAGGGTGGDGSLTAGNKGGSLQRSGSGKASRSIEEIKLVFERNKGSIYAIYNRALRDDPGLQGKVVLKMTISAAGQITDLRVESSELKAEELERKLLARIRQFEFAAKEVEVMVVSWPLDFLPS